MMPYSGSVDSTGALLGFDVIECGVSPAVRGIWYSYAGTGNNATFSINTTSFRYPRMTVFAGDCTSRACIQEHSYGSENAVSYDWLTEGGLMYYFFISGNDFYEVGLFSVSLAVSYF